MERWIALRAGECIPTVSGSAYVATITKGNKRVVKLAESGWNYINEGVIAAMMVRPCTQDPDGWEMVNDGLPNKGGSYLVTVKSDYPNKEVFTVEQLYYRKEDKLWLPREPNEEPLAYRAFPAPYRGEILVKSCQNCIWSTNSGSVIYCPFFKCFYSDTILD